jgi:hypothetical protein
MSFPTSPSGEPLPNFYPSIPFGPEFPAAPQMGEVIYPGSPGDNISPGSSLTPPAFAGAEADMRRCYETAPQPGSVVPHIGATVSNANVTVPPTENESISPDAQQEEPSEPPVTTNESNEPLSFEEKPCNTREELLEIAAVKQAEYNEAQAAKPQKKPPKESSIEGMISKTTGPFVEVGGPSEATYGLSEPIVDFEAVDKPLVVSNVRRQNVMEGIWRSPIYGETHAVERPGATYLLKDIGFGSAEHTLDAKLDAADMPDGEGYLGAMYARALYLEIEFPFVMEEAPRVLETDGILVVEKMKPDTLEALRDSRYFDVVSVKRPRGEPGHTVVVRRNNLPYDQYRYYK